MTKSEFDNFIKKEKKELFDNDFLKFPNINVLERTADKLLNLIENIKKEDRTYNTDFLSLKMDLDIFITGLPGELNNNYRNQNKRYKEKWSKQKGKLDQLISRFRSKLPDITSE